jgi:signal transduction histidine kinase
MTEFIPCPNCDKYIDPGIRDCPHCGANLAFAAILAERKLQTSPLSMKLDVPISPEMLVPRLGAYLIEKGQLSPIELQQALDYQKQQGAKGKPRLIGQALLELELIERETLDQVVTEQILQLQTALHVANQDLENRVRQRTIELEQALNRLAELNQLKSNFIANISHELRTPLTHIRGYLELLVDDGLGPLNEHQAEAIGVMQRSEERLERLIENLIEFSLFAKGDLTLQLGVVEMYNVFDEVLMECIPKCENKKLSLKSDIPEDIPQVYADHQKITWVLSQFLDNAIKFTEPGGQIQLGARLEGQLVKIYVYDTGIGISKERLKEIFEPFHQLDGSATRRYEGTGLGLAMAQRIIDTHGSKITVRSKIGEGSYFDFKLPVATAVNALSQ